MDEDMTFEESGSDFDPEDFDQMRNDPDDYSQGDYYDDLDYDEDDYKGFTDIAREKSLQREEKKEAKKLAKEEEKIQDAQRKASYPDTRSRVAGESRYGMIGKITGFFIGFCSFFAELFGTIVRNFLFNAHEQIDVVDSFKKNLARNANDNGNKEKDDKSNDVKDEKDQNKNKEQDKVKEQKSEEIVDYVKRDKEAAVILDDGEVQKIFKDMGMTAMTKDGTDQIYLYRGDDPDWLERVTSMSKTELISGNAESLASALYASRLEKGINMEQLRSECAAEALIASSMISYRCYPDAFENAQLNGKSFILGKMDLQTANGAVQLEIRSNATVKDHVDIVMNGRKICRPVDIQSLMDSKKYQEATQKVIEDALKQDRKQFHTIGGEERISFSRMENGKVSVRYANGDQKESIGKYNLREMKDLEKLSLDIRNTLSSEEGVKVNVKGEEKVISPEALAYSIAAVSCPDIKESVSDGKYYDFFADTYREAGAAHVAIEHTPEGINVVSHFPFNDEHAPCDARMEDATYACYTDQGSLSKMDQMNEFASRVQSMSEDLMKCAENNVVLDGYERSQPDRAENDPFISPDAAAEMLNEHKRNIDSRAFDFDIDSYLSSHEMPEQYKETHERQDPEQHASDPGFQQYYEGMANDAEAYNEAYREQMDDMEAAYESGVIPPYEQEENYSL